MIYKTTVVILAFSLVSAFITAQPFSLIYDGYPNGNDIGRKVIIEEDGYFLFTNSSCFIQGVPYDCTGLIKLDTQGQVTWKKFIEHHPEEFRIIDVVKGYDTNLWIWGENKSIFPAENVLLVLSPDGDSLFQETFAETDKHSYSRKILKRQDGYYAIGENGLNNVGSYTTLFKISNTGKAQWRKDYNTGHTYFSSRDAVVTEDESVVFSTIGYSGSSHDDYDSLVVFKIDSSGVALWQKAFASLKPSYDCFPSITNLHSGGFAVSWCKDTLTPVAGEIFRKGTIVFGLDSMGKRTWTWYPKDFHPHLINDLATARNGDILGCGYFENRLSPSNHPNGMIFRMTEEGELLWRRYYRINQEGYTMFELMEIKEEEDGSLVAVGWMNDLNEENLQQVGKAWLLKVDSMGCFLPDCQNDTLIFTAVEEIDGITYLEESYFKAFPNPLKDELNISFHNPVANNHATLVMTNSMGQVVRTAKLEKGQKQVRFSTGNLSQGIYSLSYAIKGEIRQTERVLKVE